MSSAPRYDTAIISIAVSCFVGDPAMPESTTAAVPLVDALAAAWNAQDVDRLLTFFSPAYEGVDVGASTPQHGLADLRANVERYLKAFPGLHVRHEETIVEGDRAVVIWTAHGRHQGSLMNI